MTLLGCIRAIEAAALEQPTVKTVVRNDVFRLNSKPDVKYGVFAWTQGTHYESLAGDTTRYGLTLFYVDRLTSDKRNQLEVQSTGILTLGNIIRRVAESGIEAEEWQYQTFNQRFTDECAGAFATVTFAVQGGGECAETFGGGDYDDDFNEDFNII